MVVYNTSGGVYHKWWCITQVVLCVAGEGGGVKEHKTSFHAISRVIRGEGILGLYNG